VIFIDTSVWVEALRSRESPVALHVVELLDSGEAALSAPVRIEIIQVQLAELFQTSVPNINLHLKGDLRRG
jgi:predicted nucleic acid-binding protein